MNTILPGTSIENTYAPLMAGGKIGGNIGKNLPNQAETSFGDIFSSALQNVNELNAIKDQDAYALAVGDIDNLASLYANAEEAQTAFQLFVQMRNKVLDSYSEIMRINL